ncbi:hypothetical protein FDM98_07385 [Microbacterium sp. TL13]|nr:hypothetical protein [Microbacterium sp. TL13]MXS74482.1 hypothetical protein [Microbacterium sp. TL13]
MTVIAATARHRGPASWVLSAVLLGVATMILPSLVAEWSSAGRVAVAGLVETVSVGFERWMSSGAAAPAAPLSDAVTFWAVFHFTKAALAIALLYALVGVGRQVWERAVRAGTLLPRAAWIAAGVLGASLPVLVLLIVVANVQGAVAPLSSVMSFLPIGTSPEVVTVRAELAAGVYGPVTSALVADFRTYHAALVVCLSVVIVGLGASVAWMLVRRARAPRDRRLVRRSLASAAVALTLLAGALGLILLANLSTVLDTAPALAGFFDSGGA